MWFKNARVYTVAIEEPLRSIFLNEQLMQERLAALRYKGISESEIAAFGFAPVLGRNTEALSFSYAGNHFFKFVEVNKLLPSTVVNQALADEVEIREAELNRPMKKSEKDALKQGLLQKMLAQAFTTRKEVLIWVNSKQGFLAVSATAAKKAENAIALLRKAFGTLPAKPLQPRCVVEERMTDFVAKANLPEHLSLGYEAVLKSLDDDGGTVRISKERLTSDENLSQIKAGKLVTQLQLSCDDNFSFILANDLCIKRITIEDQYLERNLPPKSEDAIADLQGMLVVEADILNQIIACVSRSFDCD